MKVPSINILYLIYIERHGIGPSESESLDLAILNFLQHFRMSFIGDSVPRHGRLYTRLQEAVGVKDEAMVHNTCTFVKLFV